MVLRKWNAASLWLSLINIYDCRRKLNNGNRVILNSQWSWLTGLTTNSESENWESCEDWQCGFTIHFPIHFLWCMRPLILASQNAIVTTSLTYFTHFLFLCDWLSEGRFLFWRRHGLCPKILALESSIISLLSVSRVHYLPLTDSLHDLIIWVFFILGAKD